jgi:hypothetical protein
MRLLILLLILLPTAYSQAGDARKPVARSRILWPEPAGAVDLELAPGYVTSVRFPDSVTSIVVGDPANFKAEHSPGEPRVVFFKPLSTVAMQSNALIITSSGQQFSFTLSSAGKSEADPVDYFVEFRESPPSLIVASDLGLTTTSPPDAIATQLERQRGRAFPKADAADWAAFVGSTIEDSQKMLVAFSILNRSDAEMEILPPQVELSNAPRGGRQMLKSEPILVSQYRLSSRRLAPGERADGVLLFMRQSFKEEKEQLELRLAQADKVDRPLLLELPFNASESGELP